MSRRLVVLTLIAIFAASIAAASGTSRYAVVLRLLPGDDAGALSQQLAATYRGALEPGSREDGDRFVITMSEAAASLMARDPRVVQVETVGSPAVKSLRREAHATSTWTTGVYAYDGTGNIVSIGSDTFVYDAFQRVTRGDAGAGKKQEYTYDRFGNIKTVTTDGNVAAQLKLGVDSASNQIDVNAPAYNAYGTYDAAGNMLSYLSDTFVYDGVGTMKESTVGGVRKLYLYTAGDERLAAITVSPSGIETSSAWTIRDPSGKVLRRLFKNGAGPSATWSWNEDYIYRDGQLLAAEVTGPEHTLRFHPDHLGTPRLITGNGGAKVADHKYYPFGTEATSTFQDNEAMKFTGHERDGASLDYMHARYYNPNLGRFLSVDPKLNLKRALRQPQNWNRYAYVMNNPLKYTDPTGEDVSIKLTFKGDGWTDEEKKKIISQVTSWYEKQKVGKVYVFDGAKASHGSMFSMFRSGYASLNVTSGTGSKHTASTVFAGNYANLSPQQRLNAISNSIIHETAAHQFRTTLGNAQDQVFYARGGAWGYYDAVRARYGTVADSYSYADPKTRGNVTGGPIPIHPDDQKTMQQMLGPIRVEPPDDDD